MTAMAMASGYVAVHLLVTVGVAGWVVVCWAAPAAALGMVAWRLRCRRRAGATEVAALVARFVSPRPWWWRPVFVVGEGAGVTLLAAGFVAVATVQRRSAELPVMTQLVGLPCGLAVAGAGFVLTRFCRPRAARAAAQAVLADGRAPVLYLRSFADDAATTQVDDGMIPLLHSREEQLAAALGALGPVIAVGRPGQPLPQLGAARFSLPLDDWQDTVRELMGLSRLIVLSLGAGEGLWWEVRQARATQPPRKLMLLLPGRSPQVAERLAAVVPDLPRLDDVAGADPWVRAVVVFGTGWVPRMYPVGPRTRRGVIARRAAHAMAPYDLRTDAQFVGRAMTAALASVGIRAPLMGQRARLSLATSLWQGGKLLTITGLLIWLAIRVLQWFGLG
ncbi:hypothetical protein M8542_11515 [Amycolatopsis sp. OK19-0408]|uniref:Transferase n=1 Tax=Amycolatopsis iheyensis TaxID=2945988 RepID=A0A9X2SIY3_9PSEU|nr:hypothetical protein [Amycolatopsis iheyensis]MCR6483443.1 hypothetical protein [Amycolatopsis iheyensis]